MKQLSAKVTIKSNKIQYVYDSYQYGVVLNEANNYTNSFTGIVLQEINPCDLVVNVQKDDDSIVVCQVSQLSEFEYIDAGGGGGGDLSLGETSSTAYRGDRGKVAYDYAQSHTNVDNTSDANKPVSTAQAAALLLKVDKDGTKVLSDVNFSTAKDSKLTGIAIGATANDTDANLKNRANHTGVQAASTITEDATHRFATDAEKTAWNAKQAALVSGTNIKTINGVTILGSGDMIISGAVDSVNGATGVVVLDTDDITEGTNKYVSTAQKTKLDGIATAATANDTDANLKNRANHTGTQTADTITDGTTNKAFTATEKTKLAGVATAATANSSDATLLARANHTGTQSADTIVAGSTNGVFTLTEKTKLSGIATAATANATDANLRDRTTHTGVQAISTITGLQTVIDNIINIPINSQTGDYTLVLLDKGKLISVNSATSTTITVPPNSSTALSIGTQIVLTQIGTGQITIAPGVGVTLNSPGGKLKTNIQFSTITLIKTGVDTWLVCGDLVL